MNRHPPSVDTRAIGEYLRQHACKYYPQVAHETLDVRCVRVSQRRFALLCDFELRTPTLWQPILAKVTRAGDEIADNTPVSAMQARFVGSPDRPGAEWAALSAYGELVERQADSRLFAVRVLDSLLDDRTLLMERAPAAPLTKLMHSASRLGRSKPTPNLLRAMERAGVALRTVHRMPPGDMRQSRGARRDEFLAWLDAAEGFFRWDAAAHRCYRNIAPRIRSAALELLDEDLPCGPLHNDFAPRNLLVDEQGRVAVIDMLDEWFGCVWEDVAHFLVSLEANKLQSLSGGWFFSPAALAAMRRAFLAGYAQGAAIDERVLRLFEAQIALTKWAASLHRLRGQRSLARLLTRLPQSVSSRWLARYATMCISDAESSRGANFNLPTAALIAGGVS